MTIHNNICVIIVLYNPSREQIKNINALSSTCTVVAVDNSHEASFVMVEHYVPLYGNKGIATAQNIGIRYAHENGYNYVLLLDQDSMVDANFVVNMYEEFIHLKQIDSNIAFLGPVFVDKRNGKEYKNYTDKTKAYSKISAVIASGCLISMECLDAVGGMDESLFIDLVDFEWCWRVISKGYTGYMTRNVTMIHSIGNEYHNWHGVVLGVSAPFRYYYQYRNTLWLLQRGYVPLMWKVKSVMRRLLDMVIVPLVSQQGWLVLKNMLNGVKDGLFKKNVITYWT